jgi:hypothetical protein
MSNLTQTDFLTYDLRSDPPITRPYLAKSKVMFVVGFFILVVVLVGFIIVGSLFWAAKESQLRTLATDTATVLKEQVDFQVQDSKLESRFKLAEQLREWAYISEPLLPVVQSLLGSLHEDLTLDMLRLVRMEDAAQFRLVVGYVGDKVLIQEQNRKHIKMFTDLGMTVLDSPMQVKSQGIQYDYVIIQAKPPYMRNVVVVTPKTKSK